MRLIGMTRVHPAQDNEHWCLRCGERVGLWPMAQKFRKEYPDAVLLCHVCAMKDFAGLDPAEIEIEAAGSTDEMIEELRQTRKIGRA